MRKFHFRREILSNTVVVNEKEHWVLKRCARPGGFDSAAMSFLSNIPWSMTSSFVIMKTEIQINGQNLPLVLLMHNREDIQNVKVFVSDENDNMLYSVPRNNADEVGKEICSSVLTQLLVEKLKAST